MKGLVADANIQGHVEYLVQRMQADGDFSLIPTGFRRNPLSYRRLAMILGKRFGKPACFRSARTLPQAASQAGCGVCAWNSSSEPDHATWL